MKSDFLYRALRQPEIDAGFVLIPKSQETFEALPRLGIDTRLPFVLGKTEDHAVRQHQWQQRGFPTRGISTTPHIHRAVFYAQKSRILVKIDRSRFQEFGITEYVVSDILGKFPQDIACPEDAEVILVRQLYGTWPKEVVHQILQLDKDGKLSPKRKRGTLVLKQLIAGVPSVVQDITHFLTAVQEDNNNKKID